jgi:hypothetical protein
MLVPGRTHAAMPDKNSVLAQKATSKKRCGFCGGLLMPGFKSISLAACTLLPEARN